MKSVVIRHRDFRGITEYKVYTKVEADKLGISYVYWWYAEPGDYALSDDEYVGKCITAKWYPLQANRKNPVMNRFVQTSYGAAYHKRGRTSPKLYAEGRNSIHSLSGRVELHGARKKRGLQIAKLYARTMDMDYSIHKILKVNPDWGYRNWKKWSKTEECKNMVDTELTKLLAEKGFSQAQTLDLLKETVEMAKESKDVKALVQIVDKLSKMHGIDKPTQVKSTKLLEAKKINRYLDNAGNEIEKLEMTQQETASITENKETKDEQLSETDVGGE